MLKTAVLVACLINLLFDVSIDASTGDESLLFTRCLSLCKAQAICSLYDTEQLLSVRVPSSFNNAENYGFNANNINYLKVEDDPINNDLNPAPQPAPLGMEDCNHWSCRVDLGGNQDPFMRLVWIIANTLVCGSMYKLRR